jgi:hypothetical protein
MWYLCWQGKIQFNGTCFSEQLPLQDNYRPFINCILHYQKCKKPRKKIPSLFWKLQFQVPWIIRKSRSMWRLYLYTLHINQSHNWAHNTILSRKKPGFMSMQYIKLFQPQKTTFFMSYKTPPKGYFTRWWYMIRNIRLITWIYVYTALNLFR